GMPTFTSWSTSRGASWDVTATTGVGDWAAASMACWFSDVCSGRYVTIEVVTPSLARVADSPLLTELPEWSLRATTPTFHGRPGAVASRWARICCATNCTVYWSGRAVR